MYGDEMYGLKVPSKEYNDLMVETKLEQHLDGSNQIKVTVKDGEKVIAQHEWRRWGK